MASQSRAAVAAPKARYRYRPQPGELSTAPRAFAGGGC